MFGDKGTWSYGLEQLIKWKEVNLNKTLLILSGTDEELAEKVSSAKEDVDVALFLGAPMIRIFTGILADRADQQREIRCFQEIADYAAQKGISVGLQNHPSTGDEVRRILEETDRPNFTFLLDTGQWKDCLLYTSDAADE